MRSNRLGEMSWETFLNLKIQFTHMALKCGASASNKEMVQTNAWFPMPGNRKKNKKDP
jgi:hypothetical protein